MMEIEIENENEKEKTAYEMLEESRTSMEEIAAKMFFIKKEGKPKSELRELITQMSLLFVHLRQVNRAILLEEDRVKAETESAKAPVDFTTLQLHNLVYEKTHYMKAINACRDFKSKHPDIELVPEEEFYSSAPEEIKVNALSKDSSHDLMLKRLHFELHQRKELCKLRERLEQRKKALIETIANRKKFLSSLPSHLKSLKKASLPVQQQLGIPYTKKLKQLHSAELLAPPLYVVYSQFLAQKEAFGENIDLEVVGSIKDAQTFAYRQANKDTDVGTNADSRLEDDGPDEDDDGQRRRKRPKKVPGKESLDQGHMKDLRATFYAIYSLMTLALIFLMRLLNSSLVMVLHLMKRELHVPISGHNIWLELIFCLRYRLCLQDVQHKPMKHPRLLLLFLGFLYIVNRIACKQLCKGSDLGKRLTWLLRESLLCKFWLLVG